MSPKLGAPGRSRSRDEEEAKSRRINESFQGAVEVPDLVSLTDQNDNCSPQPQKTRAFVPTEGITA